MLGAGKRLTLEVRNLEATTVDWLLQGPAFVRYRTLIDLIGLPSDDRKVQSAYDEMLADPLVSELVSQVNAWEDQLPLVRHNDASHHLHRLAFAADIGLDARELKPCVDAILRHRSAEGPYHGIPGTPHLIHPHVQNHPKRCPNRPRLPCRSFGAVKISVVSPYRHKACMSRHRLRISHQIGQRHGANWPPCRSKVGQRVNVNRKCTHRDNRKVTHPLRVSQPPFLSDSL